MRRVGMAYEHGTEESLRLVEYFAKIGENLGNRRKREVFAMYARGLMSDCERKSFEPIAAQATGEAAHAGPVHQQLQYFISEARWDDAAMRRTAAKYAIEAMERHEPVRTWVIDDTGFLKQGKASVGVQRQYTGSAGKVANCQIGVSLSVASSTQHVPIDFELFLPETWLEDTARRTKAKIPETTEFRTKHDLALGMIRRAIANGIPGDIILADSFYGHSGPFRDAIHELGFDYGVAVYANDRFLLVDDDLRGLGAGPATAKDIAKALPGARFREYTWRQGTRKALASRFAFVRVRAASSDRNELLVVEWPRGESDPAAYLLTTLPQSMAHADIVRAMKERYRTEQAYSEMKGELGLDHFEGRSFTGWHHHVSVVLCCYAFVVAERSRHFSPSEARQGLAGEDDFAA